MQVDATVREVNEWSAKATNGVINNLVSSDSFSAETVLVLANALYFNGSWIDSFDSVYTKKHPFHLTNGSSVRVPFMTSVKNRAIGTYNTFKVLNLPYLRGGNEGDDVQRSYSMSIFLPNDGDGLPSLIQRVCTDSRFLDRHIPTGKVQVGEVRIPKFKIEVDFQVMEILEQLGLKIGRLTDMAEEKQEPVIVSSMIHKAFVEVNEEGTEAADGTVGFYDVEAWSDSDTPENVDFIADHPFMFVIREDWTGLVLFAGRVLNPAR